MSIDENENLCTRAFHVLEREYQIPTVNLCLLKNIPVGAGLGGGSSDAAYTLRLLNDLFALKLSVDELKPLASQLGSDCAFFIENKPALATGRGDELSVLELDLSSYHLMIVYPDIQVSTAWAFGKWSNDPTSSVMRDKALPDILRLPVEEWKEELKNDFEGIVFREYPPILAIKKQLYEAGALYASLSGSGSALYGIFRDSLPEIRWKDHYKVFKGTLHRD